MLLDSKDAINVFCRFVTALRLPSLENKSFLDIGSPDLKIASFAFFSKASRIVWMSNSACDSDAYYSALSDVEKLPLQFECIDNARFDVIYLSRFQLSRSNFKEVITKAMKLLKEDGVLVTDLNIVDDKLLASYDDIFFSRRFVSRICDSYAWKIFGKSLSGEDVNVNHRVLHVKNRKPYAFLLMEKPGSGKTTLSRFFFKANKIPVLSGDVLYIKIANGDVDVSERLFECVKDDFRRYAIDDTINKVFEKNLYDDFFSVLLCHKKGKDIAIDTYVPSKYWPQVVALMRSYGYFPVVLGWEGHSDLISGKETSSLVESYEKYLQTYPFKDQIRLTIKNKKKDVNNFRWHIDTPVNRDFLNNNKVKVSGWICFNKASQPEVKMALFCKDQIVEFSLTKPRSDVRNALSPVFNKMQDSSDASPLGFSIIIDSRLLDGSILSVIHENKTIDLIGFEVYRSGEKSWFSLGRKGN